MAAPGPRGFLQRGGFALGHESLLARYLEDIREGLQAPYVNESFMAKSGYCVGRNQIAFLASMIIPNIPLGASLFKAKATRYARFFAEFMCPHDFATAGNITVAAAQKRVFDDLRFLLTDGNGQFSVDFNDIWYPGPAEGNDQRPAAMQAMDENMAHFLVQPAPEAAPLTLGTLISQMSDIAWEVTGSKYRKAFYRYMITNMVCMAKMGQITESKLDQIVNAMREELRISLDATYEECPEIYQALSTVIRSGNLNAVIIMRGNLGTIGLDDAGRLYLTMVQSLDTGLTGVTVVADAIAQYPRSGIWKYMAREAEIEFARWTAAARLVAADGFIGYGSSADRERVKSTLFPNLFYAARQILLIYGGEGNIRGIRTATKASKKIFIDKLLEEEKSQVLSGVALAAYEFGADESVMGLTDDMADILARLTA